MRTKICTKCGVKKPIEDFYKNGKYYNSQCKQCKIKNNVNCAKGNKKIIDYHKKYREEKKEEIKQIQKEYYEKNYEYIKEYHKIYYKENKDKIKKYREDNKDIIKRKAREYYKEHSNEINKNHILWIKNNRIQQHEYQKNRMMNDKEFKLKKQVRNMIRQSFIRKGTKKEYKCEKILGCTIQLFIEHLKNTFKDNYVYDYLSDIAQFEGTLLDKKDFVRNYLDRTYKRLYGIKGTVGEVSGMFPNNTLLITMNGHIVCSKNGVIYDTFDCRDREAEYVWLVD